MEQITAYLSATSSVMGLLVFIGIVWWAWSGSRKKANEESANLPFELPDEFNTQPKKKSNKDES
ncbi:MAG TPA: cbb3-type cytochrome c oxidase subunit 3 [Methylophilaceae bacterium]|nr:cbb3-type cytochrome c oxidase subunit 3 [Methylophilaceae bacterium]